MTPSSFGKRVARSLWRAAPTMSYSGVVGWGARQILPAAVRKSVIGAFARKVGAVLEDAENPIEQYESLQAFFTRRLKPGLRPVDTSPDAIVHPADGRLVAAGVADEDCRVEVKGISFSIPQLLGGEDIAAPFAGGAFAITYLSPKDYHRVHSPSEGNVTGWVHIPGTLFPVNDASVAREPGLFAINERHVTLLEGPVGRFAVVMVAAVGVGHITVSYDPSVATHDGLANDGKIRIRRFPVGQRPRIERGGELGIFHLGSTSIILFEKGRATLKSADVGATGRVGARIGTRA
ncbi:MAG: archaetidylserine decarboxylase [Deltaproteobacteria bacterium]|nr:archaetidylserine decarboxylase [Deltaproteobacteria bacterium]